MSSPKNSTSLQQPSKLASRLADSALWRLAGHSNVVASLWSRRYQTSQMRDSGNSWLALAADLPGQHSFDQLEFFYNTIANGPVGDGLIIGAGFDRQTLVIAGALCDRNPDAELWCCTNAHQPETKRPRHWPKTLDGYIKIVDQLDAWQLTQRRAPFSFVLIDATGDNVVTQREALALKDHLAPGGSILFKDRLGLMPRVQVGAHNALGNDPRYQSLHNMPPSLLGYKRQPEETSYQAMPTSPGSQDKMNHSPNHPAWLLDFKKDIYSQTGEDGIIKKILDVLQHNDAWCVEFGAWDGRHLSNTRNLIKHQDYSAVLIEASIKAFTDLDKHYAQSENIHTLNRYVGFGEKDKLDKILAATPLPTDFDFLSIDIDGNDYHVWDAMSRYKPKVICIEFNPTIPTEVSFVQPADYKVNQGASLRALVELAKSKGYELVSVLSYNAFFVRAEYYPLFQIENNSPETLRTDLRFITYIFSGYDGRVFLRGNSSLTWHEIKLRESKVQQLPRLLRTYPGYHGIIQTAMVAIHKFFIEPHTLFDTITHRPARLLRRIVNKVGVINSGKPPHHQRPAQEQSRKAA